MSRVDAGGRPKRPPATGELSRRQFLVRAGIGTATLLIQPVSLSGFFRKVGRARTCDNPHLRLRRLGRI
ncbi:MAG: twin-arginine translocation signal domain-containing protein [Chloroflexi bacterium]|nr:MAG: twin-arginine translocation signal domain-containing protein [Chloroflexota bacterium]